MKASARVDISVEVPASIKALVLANQVQIGGMIKDAAERTTAYKDKTGQLRKSCRVEGSDISAEVIVRVKAPHAHLVEFGHGGPQPAPPHPFLRPAKESVIGAIAAKGTI